MIRKMMVRMMVNCYTEDDGANDDDDDVENDGDEY